MSGIPIKGQARGTAAAAFAKAQRRGAKRLDFTQAYFDALYGDAARWSIDPDVLVAQWDLETGAGQSTYWERDGNPAGLAAFDDGSSWGLTFSPQKAARAHVTHMAAYLGLDLPDDWIATDARWDAVEEAGFFGVVETTADLGNGRWATDRDYARKLRERYVAYWGEPSQPPKEQPPMSDKITFGRVPHPEFVDLIVNNRYWNDLGQRRAIGVCQHSMVGSLAGSYHYINTGSGQALWDYSVGGATDGENDGVIWRHNDPKGRRAGWANGGSDGLEGDGPLFVRTLGVDAINRDLVSIERSDGGNYQSQPMSPKQFEAMAQLTAYWFDQARVPWDQFPFNPNVGCVTHMIHKEFATKDCPFPPVYGEIDRLQNRVRAILKAAQMQSVDQPDTETPPPKPIEQEHDRYPNGWTAGELKEQWGVLPRHNPGGSVTNLHFAVTKNPIATIANAWVQRGAADGITNLSDLPKPQKWLVLGIDDDTTPDLITFEGGRDAWMLFRPNKWVPWTWIDERALKAKEAA